MRLRGVSLLGYAALMLTALGVSGCGYSLAGRGSFLPAYIQTIGVPTITNRTAVFNLDTQLTQKVRSEFIGRGRYKIVPDATGVDAVLTAEVLNVVLIPTSFSSQQLASSYKVQMTARVELRDLKENKVLWENPGLTFRQERSSKSPGGDRCRPGGSRPRCRS